MVAPTVLPLLMLTIFLITFEFTEGGLVERLGEVLVDDVGRLPAVVRVQHHVPGR